MENEHPLDFLNISNSIEELKNKYSNYRMYILVREEFPSSVYVNSAAHGGMTAGLSWNGILDFDCWRIYCFKKVTCVLNAQEFENINKVINKLGLRSVEQTESRLDGAHILTMLFPIDVTLPEHKPFKFLRLLKP